jgi:hypothetical protein
LSAATAGWAPTSSEALMTAAVSVSLTWLVSSHRCVAAVTAVARPAGYLDRFAGRDRRYPDGQVTCAGLTPASGKPRAVACGNYGAGDRKTRTPQLRRRHSTTQPRQQRIWWIEEGGPREEQRMGRIQLNCAIGVTTFGGCRHDEWVARLGSRCVDSGRAPGETWRSQTNIHRIAVLVRLRAM